MDVFEVRSTPARIGPLAQVAAMGVLVIAGWMLWDTARLLILASRTLSGDVGQYLLCALLLATIAALTLGVVVVALPMAQVMLVYHFRDRGRQVVIFRLDRDGWWYLHAASSVLLPWEQLSARVERRDEVHFTLRLVPGAVRSVGHDPLSWQVALVLRLRGMRVPMTATDPTEQELADAVRRLSGGRATLA